MELSVTKNFLPVCLNLKSYKILVIGGGRVAAQKLKALLQFDCRITVVAKMAAGGMRRLARKKRILLFMRGFKDSDIEGYNLIYACTDSPSLNRRVASLAKRRRVLFNIAGNPKASNFISPAIYKDKELLMAVSTSGKNPPMAVRIRDELKETFSRKNMRTYFKKE